MANPYHPLASKSVITAANDSWFSTGGCRDQIEACYETGNASTCAGAQDFCNTRILGPLAGDWDVYYVPSATPDAYPPALEPYLNDNLDVLNAIGAQSIWQITNLMKSNSASA